MKESPHITLSEEKEKQDTIHCAMYAGVVLFGMLALMLHGLAFFSWTEPTMGEVYARRRMDNSIKTLKQDFELHKHQLETHKHQLETHKHQFWSGKIKKEVIK